MCPSDVTAAYGRVVDQYVELFGSTDSVHPDDLAMMDRHLVGLPGRVIDAGCGPGHLTAHLSALGVDVVGVDLVAAFVDHARAAHADGPYLQASMHHLPVPDAACGGILAWYSLIHLGPDEFDDVLIELRRVLRTGGRLVVGCFDGDEVAAFDHAVVTAHTWPVNELSARLEGAGFVEVEHLQRPGVPEPGRRPHGAIAATAA